MPDIQLISQIIPDLFRMEGRSEGMHVSHIINDLCVQMKYHSPREEGEFPDHVKVRMSLGNALETAIIRRYTEDEPGRWVQPGEMSCDGIFGTPDLLDVDEFVVHELKLTWMKWNGDIHSKKYWKYWVQLKSYCWMMETLRGDLQVGFVNGDYSDMSPEFFHWRGTFTKQELQNNWLMLVNHGKALQEAEGGKKKKGKRR